MKEKQQLLDSAEESFDNIKLYADQHFRLLKLELAEKSSMVISSLISITLHLVIAFFILGFGSLALGLLLGEALGSLSLAFLLITGIYVLLLICISVFRSSLIINPTLNLIIKQIFSN